MASICSTGFKISNVDMKALENDLLITPFQWVSYALKGMINKATKILIKTWLSDLKKNQPNISTTLSILVSQILSSSFYVPDSLLKTPIFPVISRIEEPSLDIISEGIIIESWEKQALDSFYENAEEMLKFYITNKINECRQRMINDWTQRFINVGDPVSIPSADDDMINLIVSQPNYKKMSELQR